MFCSKKIDIFLKDKYNHMECKRNQYLSNYTTMKVGGQVEFMTYPTSIAEMINLLRDCEQENISYFILGKGSNIIVNDEGVELFFINIQKLNCIYLDDNDDTKIIVEAGVNLLDLSNFALQHSLTGLEFACGIPGTVGGAVFMNAGAYDGEIKDVLYSSTVFHKKQGEIILNNQEHQFSYRNSAIAQNRSVVLSSVFQLQKGIVDLIKNKMDDYQEKRESKQPLEHPSAGSTFKRPEGYFAGKLIMDAGLQGMKMGGVSISMKHAGFIVNDNNAKAQDILDLITHIQLVVWEKFEVSLEPEVKFLEKNGEFRKFSYRKSSTRKYS